MRTWTVRGYELCLGRRGDLGLWERPLDTRAVAPEIAPGEARCLVQVGHCQIEHWSGHLVDQIARVPHCVAELYCRPVRIAARSNVTLRTLERQMHPLRLEHTARI